MAKPGKGKKVLGCGILGCLVGILAAVGFVWLMWTALFTNRFAEMMGEETHPISGDPTRFDPIAALPEITKKAGPGAFLVELNLTQVRSDGTLDLMADYLPAPRAEYVFMRKLDKAPDGRTTPPIGAGRTPDSVWIEEVRVSVYEPGQRRRVSRRGGDVNAEYSYTNEGMDIDRNANMLKPKPEAKLEPSLKSIWETALRAGAPKDAVAEITFQEDQVKFNVPAVLNLRWEGGKLDEFFLSKEAKAKLGLD